MTLRSGSFGPVRLTPRLTKSPPGDGAGLGQAKPSSVAEAASDDRPRAHRSWLLITSGTAGTVEP